MDNTSDLHFPLSNLTCRICYEIFTNPHKISCPNEHIYCLKCIMQHWNVQRDGDLYNKMYRIEKECPTCRSRVVIQETCPDICMRRMVSNIQQNCKYSKNGCTWFCEPGSHSSEDHECTCT